MAHILAIDDDPSILTLIKTSLERQGHQVTTLSSTTNLSLKHIQWADLILLDVMMPDEDGFTFLKRSRNTIDVPVIFITAKTSEADTIQGLGIGADDYIEKPFSIGELRARVSAHLRREKRVPTQRLSIGQLTLDLTSKQLYVNEQLISLTKSEGLICEYLMLNVGQVFSKEQIYVAVFGYDGNSNETVITEHIKNIRQKIRDYHLDPIETVWGIGYRWKKENPLV